VDTVLDAPAAAYVALMIATLLLLVEIALPTVGIAGTGSLILAALGIAAIVRGQLVWWPLLISAAGITIWVVELARRRDAVAAQVAAGVCFAAGSIGFGLVARGTPDVATLAIAAVGSVVLPLAYPRLYASTRKLMEMPPDVGIETLVGRKAKVARWSGTDGSVALDGSFWSAFGPEGLEAGDEVVVAYIEGMRARVQRPGNTSG